MILIRFDVNCRKLHLANRHESIDLGTGAPHRQKTLG